MSITVFHSLTATTPDNTQYEIRPSHWNSNHVVSLSLGGSDLSGAFANSPTVTFGSSAGSVTASVNTSYIALSNSSSIMPIVSSSNFLGSAASGSFIATSVSSSIMPIASSSNFLGSAASGSFVNTSVSSRFAGTGFTSTTTAGTAVVATLNTSGLSMGIPAFITAGGGGGNFSAGISTGGNTSGTTGTVSNQIVFVGGNNVTLSGSTAAGGATVTISGANLGGAQTGISGMVVSNTTYTSGTVSFRDGNNISFASGTGQGISITHNLQSAGAYLTTAMQSNAGSNFLGTNTALTANGVSVTANSSGLSLNFPAFLTTAAQSSASNVSAIVAGTASNGGTTTLAGAVSFSNANGVSFYTSAGGAVVATVKTDYLTTAMQSNAGSNFLGTNTALTANGVSVTANSSGLSLNFPAFLTTAMQSQSSSVFAKTGFTSATTAGTAIVATHDTAGLSMGVPAYITTAMLSNASTAFAGTGSAFTNLTATFGTAGLSLSAPATSSLSGTGALSIATNVNTISIGVPAVSMGISGGNTSGNTGTVSNQFVLAGGNNVTLSGSTNAAGMTVTVSANTAAAANLSVSAGTTSGAFGGITFANSNNVTFGLNNGTITASVPSGGGGVAVAASNTTYTSGTVSFRDGNNITFASGTGQGISITHNLQSAGAYLTTAMQSNAGSNFLGTNTALTANGVSVTANSSGLSLNFPAFLTTAAQSSASNVSQIIAATNSTGGGTSTLTGGVTFGNSNGVTHYVTNGSVVASVKTDYLTTAMQSNAGSNFLGTNTALTANGVSVTANSSGLSLNFPAFLTTAAQSSASNVSQIIAATNSTGGGTSTLTGGVTFGNLNGFTHYITNGSVVGSYTVPTVPTSYVSNVNGSSGAVSVAGTGFSSTTTVGTAIVGTLNTAGLSLGVPAYLTAAAGGGGVAIAASNTTYNTGTVSFRDGNNITFASGTGQGISITHNLQSANANYLTSQTNQTVGFYASSNTTAQSSSSTFDARSMTFVGAGGVSIGASAGSIIFSGATGGGGGGGGVAIANSQTTYTSGTVQFLAAGGAITIASDTGQQIDFSVPAQSSLYGVSGILITSNGSSISIGNDFNKTWEVMPMFSANLAISTLNSNTLQFMPLFPQDNYTFTGIQMAASLNAGSATNASYAASHQLSFALYSVNTTATTMSLLGSSSVLIAVSGSSNNRAGYTISYDSASSTTSSSAGTGLFTLFINQRVMNFPFASSLQDGGAYAFGFAFSSTTTNANAAFSSLAWHNIRYGNSNITAYGVFDVLTPGGTNNSVLLNGFPFMYSASSGGWPSTIGFSDRRQLSTPQFPYLMFRGT